VTIHPGSERRLGSALLVTNLRLVPRIFIASHCNDAEPLPSGELRLSPEWESGIDSIELNRYDIVASRITEDL